LAANPHEVAGNFRRTCAFPGEFILDLAPRFKTHPLATIKLDRSRHWMGYWPGAVAPTGVQQHIETIQPSQECWCCSGKLYGDCHRSVEAAILLSKRAHDSVAV
jgi:hypothetical protein